MIVTETLWTTKSQITLEEKGKSGLNAKTQNSERSVENFFPQL